MSQVIRVNSSEVKTSSRTRMSCASVMATQVQKSAFYQDHPTVKASCDGVVKAGTSLAAADEAVSNALAALRNARKVRKGKVAEFDSAFNVCVAQVEQHATAPEDVTSVALTVVDRKTHELTPPTALTARFNPADGNISVRVTLPFRLVGCVLEVTANPADPSSYRRVPGSGQRRTLTGYPPGTYAFRASSMRAHEESAPTAPVMVTVK